MFFNQPLLSSHGAFGNAFAMFCGSVRPAASLRFAFLPLGVVPPGGGGTTSTTSPTSSISKKPKAKEITADMDEGGTAPTSTTLTDDFSPSYAELYAKVLANCAVEPLCHEHDDGSIVVGDIVVPPEAPTLVEVQKAILRSLTEGR